MEVNALVKRFCDEARQFQGFTEKTIRRYRTVVELFCRQVGILRTRDINAAIVREWFFRGRADRNWGVATFRTYYKSLKVFFRWCRKQGWLEGDPLADLAVPKEERRLPPRLTLQEAMRLLEITRNYPWTDSFVRCRNHGIIATFLFAGLRKSEVLNLRFADVDLANLSIFVRRGKGKKDRIVPVSETLADILAQYAQERSKRRKTCPEFFTKQAADGGCAPTVSPARRAFEAGGSTGLGRRTPLLRQGYRARGVRRAHSHTARSLKATALHYSFFLQRPLHRSPRDLRPQTRRIPGVGCRERWQGLVGGKLTTYHLIGGASRALRPSQPPGSARFTSLHRRACWFSASRPSNWGCPCFAAMTSAASFSYTKG